MTRPVILTAGKATRAGHYAPAGCKALVVLAGRPVIEWQLDVLADLGEPVIVCRTEHAHLLSEYGEIVTNDDGRGAADALASALTCSFANGAVVAYADTWFDTLPDGEDWMGVWPADGGRSWYVVNPHGTLTYRPVPAGETALVGIGLFHFADVDRLRTITDRFGTEWRWHGTEWGLDVVANSYGLTPVPVPSWRDVGDEASIERWAA